MTHVIQTYRETPHKIKKIVGHMTSFRTPTRFSAFERKISVPISPNVPTQFFKMANFFEHFIKKI